MHDSEILRLAENYRQKWQVTEAARERSQKAEEEKAEASIAYQKAQAEEAAAKKELEKAIQNGPAPRFF